MWRGDLDVVTTALVRRWLEIWAIWGTAFAIWFVNALPYPFHRSYMLSCLVYRWRMTSWMAAQAYGDPEDESSFKYVRRRDCIYVHD